MIVAKKYNIPKSCPKGCKFQGCLSQGDYCYYCPVLCCRGNKPLIHPDGYREDWIKEWVHYFKTGKTPILRY